VTAAALQADRRAKWYAALRRHIQPGELTFIEVRHEAWCPTRKGLAVCLCNPDRVIADDRGRVLTRIRGAGPYRAAEVREACE